MEQISTYNIPAGLEAFLTVRERGVLPPILYEPMQALVRHFTGLAAEKPVLAYIFSNDDDAERRDLFSYALTRTLLQHIPSALLVDCDFLGSGMHGIVPEKDALGFLDFLLYGSSLGVIMQETSGGVRVIGPGSFPVTRKMPFVPDAFNEAAGRLVNHARCVIFVGPMYDDDGDMHPLIGLADLPVLVSDDGNGEEAIRPIEENIASRWKRELLSVRIGGAPSPPPPVSEPLEPEIPAYDPTRMETDTRGHAPSRESAPPSYESPPPSRESAPPSYKSPPPSYDNARAPDALPAAPRPLSDRVPVEPPGRDAHGRMDETPVPAGPADLPPEFAADEARYTSLVPRILTALIGILVIVFIAWWFWEERSRGELDAASTGDVPAQTTTAPPATVPPPAADVAVRDTVKSVPVAVSTPPGGATTQRAPEVTIDPTDTGGRSGGTVLMSSEDIMVMADLVDNWTGWYVIHISSFRVSIKAREEAAFLETHEFPVFIIFLDLGAKGKWYRIYSGPFRTREEAREVKKNLDDITRVRFTRISKVAR
ncbi:MAG: SPOR domain-containing protein [Candidatus Krumholzibacteriota bacterium]|nr:SPOR domain-containing protein [Candidatus Krumholzibacteriota bacterium]